MTLEGTLLAGYLLTERLGAGAVTEAFVAKSFGAEGFEKEVVVKRVHDRLASITHFTEALVEEAKRASQLSHSNVAQLIDSGKDTRRGAPAYFVVTERVRGVDLSTLVERARAKTVAIPTRLVLHVVSEIAKALDHAHRRRRGPILHGGLSPSNVLIAANGEVKVSDFGLHRALRAASFAPHESRSLPYQSPEALAGEGETPGSDLFALGALAFELAAQRPLFLGDSPESTRANIASGMAANAPGEIDRAVLALVERLTGPARDRPAASEVHEELVAWAYDQGHVGAASDDLAAFVSRVAREAGPAEPSAVLADVVTEEAASVAPPAPPASETSDGAASRPSQAHVRLVTFLVARHDEGESSSGEVLTLLRERGATELSRDATEVRAVFGLRDADGRDVARALDAALEARARWPKVGFGLDLGSVVVDEQGAIASGAELVPRFRGAAALAASDRGKVLVTGGLAKIAASEFDIEHASGSAAGVTKRRERALFGGRFVGRRRELSSVGDLFSRVVAGEPQVARVTGPAGIGKTRLLFELERRVLRAHPETRTEVLAVPATREASAIAARARALVDGAVSRPVLLAIDDCEHLDAEGIEEVRALLALAERPGAKALVLLTGRALPGELATLAGVDLGPLDMASVAELAASVLGARVLLPELLDLVADYAEGVPMFVEHLLRDLAEAALVSVRGGVAKVEGARASVPRVPRAWLESSLARLGGEAQRVLRAMSVLEGGSDIEEIAEVAGFPREHALAIAESFVPSLASIDRARRGAAPLLTRAVRDVALAGIVPEERRELHLACARVIETRAGAAPPAETLARVAAHLAEGGDRAGARMRWAEVSRRAKSAAERARAARNVLALADTDRSGAATLEPGLAVEAIGVLAATASLGLRVSGAADLAIACLEPGPAEQRERVSVRIAAVKICAAEHAIEQALVALEQAAALAAGDPSLETLVLAEEVRVAALAGDIHRGAAAAERALDRADLTDVGVVCEAAEILAATRNDAAAKAALVRAEQLVHDDDSEGRALIEAKRARVELWAGDPHAAIRTSRIAADLARGVDALVLFAESKLRLGEASIALDARERAYAAFTAALEAAEACGSKRLETLAKAHIAHVDATSRPPRAGGVATLRGIVSAASASGVTADAVLLRTLLGEALAHAGEHELAEAELRSAEAQANASGHLVLAASARAARGA